VTVILRESVVSVLYASGVPEHKPDLPDLAYALPRKDYLTGEFAKWLGDGLRIWDLNYMDDAWDCDNFSEFARVMAQIAHKRTSNTDEALAVGVFEYVTLDFTGHSICCAVCAETPDRLTFLEPQPNFSCMQEVVLNPKEIASCLRLRM
jgi:hypothetical protein